MASDPEIKEVSPVTEQDFVKFKIENERIEVSYNDGKITHVYIFRIPSIRDMTRMGVRERDLRIMDSSTREGSEVGIDIVTELLYRAMALFELLLEKTSDTRIISDEKQGVPVIDSNKFGPDIDPALLIGVQQGFEKALDSFRKRGN